jgi:hypothetical protein
MFRGAPSARLDGLVFQRRSDDLVAGERRMTYRAEDIERIAVLGEKVFEDWLATVRKVSSHIALPDTEGNSSKLRQLFPTAGVIGRNCDVERTPPLTIYA